MSILKEFDPTYKLDKKIKREIEKGNFVPTTKTENGIRGQYLRQRPDMKIRYEMAMDKRRKIIKAVAISGGITLVTLGGFVYKQVTAPKQSIDTTTNKFFEEGMDIINTTEEERKVQRDNIVEDVSQMSASDIQNYTKQVIVDVHNKKNPKNQIQMEELIINRETTKLLVTKDKLGNTVSYSIYTGWPEPKVNQEVEVWQEIVQFSLNGEVVAMMKTDGSSIEIDGGSKYNFSEFASLLRSEKNLVRDLNDSQYARDNKELKGSIELEQRTLCKCNSKFKTRGCNRASRKYKIAQKIQKYKKYTILFTPNNL